MVFTTEVFMRSDNGGEPIICAVLTPERN